MPRPKKEQPNHAGGLYEVKITIGKTIDGKLIRKSFYSPLSKADAREQAEKWKIGKEAADLAGIPLVEKTTNFSEWADKWLEIYKKPNVSKLTYNGTYKNIVDLHLKPYFKKADLRNIKPVDIQRFFDTKRDFSETMLHKMKICINGIFETAIDNDLCIKNPSRFVKYTSGKEKKEKRFYTEEQEQVVSNLCMEKLPGVVLCLETGIRPGEFVGLQWPDIQGDILWINRSIAPDKEEGYVIRPPKWDSYRAIPLSPKALQALDRLDNDDLYIFPRSRNVPYTPRAWDKIVQRELSKILSDTGIPVLSPHEFRHTYATRLRREGRDIHVIQKVLGHKSINVTTETYVHTEISVIKKSLGL